MGNKSSSPRNGGSGGQSPMSRPLDESCSKIADNYNSLEVVEALASAGLKSSNLIVGIDFTKSNEWAGKWSYNGRSLHRIGRHLNPYEQAISIIGETLADFDDDNLIPCYGFGDASTQDENVFRFCPDDRYCNGFGEVLSRYREIVPQLKLAGTTSFAPVIEMAMTIVGQSGGEYHILLIITDGHVTIDTQNGQLSLQVRKTAEAIIKASKFPLSIILVGIGDGPWDMISEFCDSIGCVLTCFENFQFVNFTEIMSKDTHRFAKKIEFALAALMKVPSQYNTIRELGLLGVQNENAPQRVALPPPGGSSFQPSSSLYYEHNVSAYTAPSAPSFDCEKQVTEALPDDAGFRHLKFIVGIDFTQSDEGTGSRSYGNKHYVGACPNPYERAISIIGKSLAASNDGNLIHCFGFGDASISDHEVFSFYPDCTFCYGFEEVLSRYREIVPHLRPTGPRSFVPITEMAMNIVEKSGGQYHVLLIIANGQVTRSVDTQKGKLSQLELENAKAIVKASKFPLSIILVGVGDGPWDMISEFRDSIGHARKYFDNFQIVNFTDTRQSQKQIELALPELILQYKTVMELGLLGVRNKNAPKRVARPPPSGSSVQPSSSSYDVHNVSANTALSAPSLDYENHMCPICLSNQKNIAFGCGHDQTCCSCGHPL